MTEPPPLPLVTIVVEMIDERLAALPAAEATGCAPPLPSLPGLAESF